MGLLTRWMGAVRIFLVLALVASVGQAEDVPRVVDFNRDIRPILSETCFQCHGPDKSKRKADLRLDTKEGAFQASKGYAAIVPGKPDESELYARVSSEDDLDRMPPPKSGLKLSQREIELIRQWIDQGAEWKRHWSFLKPVRPPVPTTKDSGFARNDIDRFIIRKLVEKGLEPLPEADRVTLIRRLNFDLIGLPPTPAEVDAFVNDRSPDAYETLVDRLLASPHYGERLAQFWLDLVRFADTIGYHSDNPQNIDPYRDYVIKAFNDNVPFDRFTTEQLAGDLVPGDDLWRKVASGYNRLLQTTEEGGAQAKEYIVKYAADRVRNASTVWLGATLGCAECHDHKFDPFTTKEFYRFAAFFADVQEAAVGKREPGMPVPDERQAADLKRIDEAIVAAKTKLDTTTPDQSEWEKSRRDDLSWHTLEPTDVSVAGESTLQKLADGVLKTAGKIAAQETYSISARTDLKGITGIRIEALADGDLSSGGPGTAPNGNFVLSEFKLTAGTDPAQAKPVALRAAVADFAQDGFPVVLALDGDPATGWAVSPAFGQNHVAVFETGEPIGGDGGTRLTFTLDFKTQFPQHNLGKLRLSATTTPSPSSRWLPPNLQAALALPPEKRTEKQRGEVAAYFRTITPALQALRGEIAALEKQKAALVQTMPMTLVTMSGEPRVTRILPRGNWMAETGEVVVPGVPESLGSLDVGNRRPTRLDLARWLTSRDHPLTARVFVNRLWRLTFGQGIVTTLDDFGAQGTWPTHPELLDWLAIEFIDSGWDVKHILKLMVTSATYRQSSQADESRRQRDPYNRWLARQARFRLDAELVRDNALAVSGLLVQKVGGPSAKPYQPAGYWSHMNFPKREYEPDHGDGLYRRGLYSFWCRTFPHPSLLAFDAPSREECKVERPRSNTPLQGLVLLNDPTYIEAARVLAERIIREGGQGIEPRLQFAYRAVLSRSVRPAESSVLTALYEQHLNQYRADKSAARELTHVGERPVPADVDESELAAWTSVARVILNLHETITRN